VIKKVLAVGIILLFIGIAFAPSINFNVVKASIVNKKITVIEQRYQKLENTITDFKEKLTTPIQPFNFSKLILKIIIFLIIIRGLPIAYKLSIVSSYPIIVLILIKNKIPQPFIRAILGSVILLPQMMLETFILILFFLGMYGHWP